MAKKKIVDASGKDDIKRIYRSKEDRMIGGVCGGIAEFMNIDPVWVRLVAVLLIFFDGVGILIYIILWILIPENPYQQELKKKKNNGIDKDDDKIIHENVNPNRAVNQKKDNASGRLIIGGLLILIGMLFFFRQFFHWVSLNYLWPLILIGIGLVLLLRR